MITMIGMKGYAFEVDYGPMTGGDLPQYIYVIGREDGAIFYVECDEHGSNFGRTGWLSPGAWVRLNPLKPGQEAILPPESEDL